MYEITFNGRTIGEVCATHFCKETISAKSASIAIMLLSANYERISGVAVKRIV